jgi:hypothetical protein
MAHQVPTSIGTLKLNMPDSIYQPLLKRKRSATQSRNLPGNLTNEQIRELLKESLSLGELQAIARQLSISTRHRSIVQLQSSISSCLERCEGYQLLRSPVMVAKSYSERPRRGK